jgi:hypothetical protein
MRKKSPNSRKFFLTVKVYRNLRHGRKARALYSIMYQGRVMARRHRVLLSNAKFVVSEVGRQRVLKSGHKNVHAYVVGKLVSEEFTPKGEIPGCMGIDENGLNLPWKIHYNPYLVGHFIGQDGKKVNGAGGVLLNEHGMTAAYIF